MLEVEQYSGSGARIALVHQDSTPTQQVPVPLERQVGHGVEQGMPRTHKGRERLTLRRHQLFLKGDPLVARQDRLADADQPVAVTHRGGNVRDLEAAWLTL